MGLPQRADFSDPDLLAVIDRVLELAQTHDLYTGIFTVDTDAARAMARKGFNLITCGTDVLLLQQAAKEWLGRQSDR
jgi:4-hydroxy-2-oxoheptanedioate aldolase